MVVQEPIQIQAISSNSSASSVVENINGSVLPSGVHIPGMVQVVQFSPVVDLHDNQVPEVFE